jgi:phage tail protein X
MANIDHLTDHYRTRHMRSYVQPDQVGYMALPVLPQLIGRKWDAVALGLVHALRPSAVRVTRDEETTDAVCWRVTVRVGGAGRIEEIYQEVEVGLPDGVNNGHEMRLALRGKAGCP